MSAMKKVYIFWLLILSQALLWIVFLRHLPFFRAPLYFLDFDNYLHLWRDVFAGLNPYRVSHMITLGPPLVLLPYLPFLFLPLTWSQFIFFVLNVYCGFALCQKITQGYGKGDPNVWLFLSLLLFASFPVRFSLLMGQPSLIIAYLVVQLLTHSQRQISLISLVVFKTFFGGMLLVFIRRKGLLLRSLFGLTALVFAFSPLLKLEWYSYYLRDTFSVTVTQAPGEMGSDYYNQSLKSTLHRLGGDNFYLPLTLLGLIVLGWGIVRSGSIKLAALTSILLSPVIWQHYMVFIYPLIALMFFETKSWSKRVLLLMIFLMTSVSLPALHSAELSFVTALLASHMFFGLVILLGLLIFELRPRETRRLQIQSEENLF